jgi:tetratricopeptide (TPR) repeat protein
VSKEAEQLNIRGFNEKASGDDVKAISTYEECIKLYPDFEWPYSNLGSLYLDRGDTAKAEELLKEAIAINPNYVNALVALAKTKRKQNDPTAAQKYIDTARACVHGDSQMEDMVNKSADN